MKYSVCWRPEIERKLNEIWNEATDKNAISEAADAMDRELRTRPLFVGESRDELGRFRTAGPLAIYYDVHELDRSVDVWSMFRV